MFTTLIIFLFGIDKAEHEVSKLFKIVHKNKFLIYLVYVHNVDNVAHNHIHGTAQLTTAHQRAIQFSTHYYLVLSRILAGLQISSDILALFLHVHVLVDVRGDDALVQDDDRNQKYQPGIHEVLLCCGLW